MKKLFLVLIALFMVFGAFAQEEMDEMDAMPVISFDGGSNISMAFYPAGTFDNSSFGAFEGIFATLASLRGGVYGSARFNINEMFSVGAQVGFNGMSVGEEKSVVYLDIPVRALVRVDLGGLAVGGFAGYYLDLIKPSSAKTLGGLEYGFKGFLGGLYVGMSTIVAPTLTYSRGEIGFQITNMFGF